jgi:hypothetical protein
MRLNKLRSYLNCMRENNMLKKFNHIESLQQIIDFMKFKSSVISDQVKDIKYFTEQDEEQLKQFNDKLVKRVYLCIKYTIAVEILHQKHKKIRIPKKIEHIPFDAFICPFCIVFYSIDNYCKNCPYKKNHGYCLSDDSDYHKIYMRMRSIFNKIAYNSEYVKEIKIIFNL